MKKLLAFLLVFTLLVIPFSIILTAGASNYIDVTLTSTDGWNTCVDGDHWVLYLNTSGYECTDWNYKYKGFTYEIDGVQGTTSQVSSAGNNNLYCTIPTSEVPATDGTVFTIKAGYYDPDAEGTTSGLHITEDFVVVASESRLVNARVIDPVYVDPFNHSANAFYFNIKDANGNPISTGFEHWERFLSPAWCDGTRITQDTVPNQWSTVYSGVFIDGQPMDYWGAHFKNVDAGTFYIDGLNAVAGTTVTVKGYFASSSQGTGWPLIGNYFLTEMTFTYDGSAWNYSRPITYRDITLTSTDGWNTSVSGDNWVVYLNTSNYASTNWDYKYKGFTYEIGGVQGTTTQVSSVDGNKLYFTIPTSSVPATDGTVFTIKAGKYAPDANVTRKGLNITEDFEIVVSEGHLVHTRVIDAATVEPFNHSASSFYFNLKDANGTPISTGFEHWERFLSPAWCDGTRITQDTVPNQWSTVYSGVFIDGQPMDYWGAHFKNVDAGTFYIDGLNAVAGTTVTVKGYFASSSQGTGWPLIGNYFLTEMTFTYDGSTWNYMMGDITYTDYEGTPVFEEKTDGLHFSAGETEFPYDAENWTVKAVAADDEESGVFLNGEKTDVYLKKVNVDDWYVCLGDAGITLADGDEVTVAGKFIYDTHRITFAEVTFTYEEETVNTYTGTPKLLENDEFGKASGFYFQSTDGAPATGWGVAISAVDGDANGVFVNDVKTAINLKKTEANVWYVCIADAGVTLNYGDVLKIKGSFQIGEDIVTFNEAVFQYDGKHFAEGTFTATDFTITGLAYSDIVYDETNSRWNMFFTLSNNIPGDVDATYYPYMTYEINGTEYSSYFFKSSSAHTVDGEVIYNLYIPMPQLPKDLDGEYVITVKSGAAQRRTSGTNVAHADGIRLTEDFEISVGNEYSASAPVIDYLVGNGGNANGIYLSSKDSFPTIGWDYSLTKYDANSGIYVNGESTDVFIKKYEDNKYYVCLSDLGITAEEGTIVMIKGTFATAKLNSVTFQTAKYIFTDGQWKAYSATVDIESTGVTGDANGDGAFNILDFIAITRYVEGETDTIGATDADMNGDGVIDATDKILIKKVLLGALKFENGSLITGVPTYNNTDEMRLAAYVSPTLEEGFADYKAAGFTTLIGENRALYAEDGFDEYMNAAAESGLDVLVQSGYLQSMLTGESEVNQAWLQEMYNNLSKYSNFRGLFMGDEPRIAQLGSYTSVTTLLRSLDPHMDLFTSCLPTYTDESLLSTDSSLSLVEKYSNYANAYGNILGEFTYDFYPFRHKVNTFLGITTSEKDYMRSDWFQNLTLAAANAKGKYDTGITVQTYSEKLNSKDYYRAVTKADVSFQVYSALAYGMKSINYFTYGEHWDESVGTTSCMIYNGEKTDVYYAVQSVNNEIKAFDNVLLNFNWQGTIGIKGDDSDGMMDYVDAYTSKRISAYSASNDAIIGCLKDSVGYDGFMLVNATDPADNITETISVTFNNANHAKVFVNGVESTVELVNGVYEATLTPGQGIFVIPYIA